MIIKKALAFLLLCTTLHIDARKKNFTIMLDPAGDASYSGRRIADDLERGLSLQFAEKLKHSLEKSYRTVRVVLTRFPGEKIQPLQNAAFSNQLQADLFLSIHICPGKTKQASIYYFCQNPITDSWTLNPQNFSFTPYHQAYKEKFTVSKSIAHTFSKSLAQNTKGYACAEACGYPCKPLVGVQAPALTVEFALPQVNDWNNFVEPCAQALGEVIRELS